MSTTADNDPENQTPSSETVRPYSVFSKTQKQAFIYLLAYLSLASSLTATIYFPLIPLLADEYHTTTQGINLTITLYVVFQGVAPSFWTPVGDKLGRRPVFIFTFTVYTLASLGLALSYDSRSYVALILLRAAQSIGGSAVLALAYAVVADIAVHSERGSLLGPLLAASNLGPCVGPVIGGGAILSSGDPAWCFWALFIFGASAFLLLGFLMPETLRTVVGNGEVPAVGMWRTWYSIISPRLQRKGHLSSNEKSTGAASGDVRDGELHADSVNATGRGKWVIPNPLSSVRLLFYWHALVTLLLAGLPYGLWYCIQTSIPVIYGDRYGFDDLQIGLCYLAGGAGVIFGGLTAGRLMDRNYKHVAKKSNIVVDRVRGDNMNEFPLEQARSRGSIRILGVSLLAVLGWGWACQYQVHPAVPLLIQAYIGWKCTVLHQFYSALMVDMFPEQTGTAAAANNIVRCALSAAAVAVMQPLVDALRSWGWTFTLLGLVDAVGSVLFVVVLRRFGKGWRDMRTKG